MNKKYKMLLFVLFWLTAFKKVESSKLNIKKDKKSYQTLHLKNDYTTEIIGISEDNNDKE